MCVWGGGGWLRADGKNGSVNELVVVWSNGSRRITVHSTISPISVVRNDY